MPGMYFGEEQILNQRTVPCRVSVTSDLGAVVLGFTKDTLEFFFDSKVRADWLTNHILVKFPHEEQVRHDTLI